MKQDLNNIEKQYIATHRKSEELYRRAQELMPTGITHDARAISPFPYYIQKGYGSKIWDVDGNELYDCAVGHGALILGHNHPAIIAAVSEQIKKGFHFSACHELEIKMSEMISRLVPCAEIMRYMQSGSEANMLAIRVARAYTGKNKIIKFKGHFHGYWDEGVAAVGVPFDTPMSIGVPKESIANVSTVDHNNSSDVRRLIEETNDVACVLIDPSGHLEFSNRPGFLEELRQITREKSVVLIFDEVVSAFRYAPGGMQEISGVIPDLVVIGKILGGGLPASAVAGRRDILNVISKTGDRRHDRFERVISQGTHSGNPVSLAAGLATLEILSTGEPQRYLNKIGRIFRERANEIIKKRGIAGCCHGNYWATNMLFLGEDCPMSADCDGSYCSFTDYERLKAGTDPMIAHNLNLAMIINGISTLGPVEFIFCTALTEPELDDLIQRFDKSLDMLQKEKIL